MTDRRRRQKDNRAARRQAEQKAETRREVFRRIGFALLMGTALVVVFVVVGLFGGDPETLPGSYEGYRSQTTACGAEAPPAEQVMSFETFEDQPDVTADAAITATITTSCGVFVVELEPASAPQTVESFVFLARQGYFDGTVIHRIVEDFRFQGGDPDAVGTGGPGYSIADEFPADDFVYERGVVAMANAGRGTTGSQFFVVVGDDASVLTPQYNVLGRVTAGDETLDLIAAVPTATRPGSREVSLPLETVFVESVEIAIG